MGILSPSKWELINSLVLIINGKGGLMEMRRAFLEELPRLIPCDRSFFLLGGTEEAGSVFFAPVYRNITEENMRGYIHDFASTNPSLRRQPLGECRVYRENEFINQTRLATDIFYNEWMFPQHIEFILGAKIAKDGILYGLINLLRTHEQGSFTETDEEVMRILSLHIAQRLHLRYPKGVQNRKRIQNADVLGERYGLTYRELDVCHLIFIGYSSREIAEKLLISENTVKKHTRSIFAKLGVKNRSNLIRIIHDFNETV